MAGSRIVFVAVFALFSVLNALPVSDESGSPLEFGDNFQGDIILTPEQEDIINGNTRGARTGLLNTKSRWPKNSSGYVVVPYTFQAASGFTTAEKNAVLSGLRELESRTCIRFVQRTTQADYVEVYNGSGCSSYLGRLGGKQQLSLNRGGCTYKGTAIHEFIHALGYTHMHNHIDRDRFVRVYLENVKASSRHNFNKVSAASYGNFGTSYDYMSVMHYPRWAFSTNGKDTIVPLDRSFIDRIGTRELTTGDVARVNNMYQC